ncbi:hypothetical protein PPERSA_08110 [Pseudocohnilembus persalinus]|uniref:Uncharacterized protein n=1 Tax=Pseudocohnilembus persalinus TaxID=266149 RepID=A0A0V0QLA4_PSEPJ|nr:hypothetical protein PPERSA_08110 [Pseudocohnilembus persalinus]|eukprot:KRX03035.1 hypothetical protein PPERSA_08110 [Pseudocohnilembus persalinus]
MLKILLLKENKLQNFDGIINLKNLKQLKILDLRGNSVTQQEFYTEFCQKNLCNLQFLDTDDIYKKIKPESLQSSIQQFQQEDEQDKVNKLRIQITTWAHSQEQFGHKSRQKILPGFKIVKISRHAGYFIKLPFYIQSNYVFVNHPGIKFLPGSFPAAPRL